MVAALDNSEIELHDAVSYSNPWQAQSWHDSTHPLSSALAVSKPLLKL
jgi:hypothetical protein